MLYSWNRTLFICVLTPESRRGHSSALKGERVQTQNSCASLVSEGKYWMAEWKMKDKEQLLTQLLWPHTHVSWVLKCHIFTYRGCSWVYSNQNQMIYSPPSKCVLDVQMLWTRPLRIPLLLLNDPLHFQNMLKIEAFMRPFCSFLGLLLEIIIFLFYTEWINKKDMNLTEVTLIFSFQQDLQTHVKRYW